MDNFNNSLLPTVNHLSTRLGPVMKLFDGLLERITPQTTATACGGYYCDYVCNGGCDAGNGLYHMLTRYTEQNGCIGANCWIDWGCRGCGG
jgi:hypothetical protein